MSELSERIRRNTTPNLDGWMKRLMTEAADELERLEGLLSDEQYIRMRADYAKGHKSWANMINEREARR